MIQLLDGFTVEVLCAADMIVERIKLIGFVFTMVIIYRHDEDDPNYPDDHDVISLELYKACQTDLNLKDMLYEQETFIEITKDCVKIKIGSKLPRNDLDMVGTAATVSAVDYSLPSFVDDVMGIFLNEV